MDGDLLQFKAEMGEFPPAEAVRLLAQASLGLVSLYRLGVIHGDIKPGNILYKVQGDTVVYKIADYESAQLSNTVRLRCRQCGPRHVAGDGMGAGACVPALHDMD